jgi:hypothetical protein
MRTTLRSALPWLLTLACSSPARAGSHAPVGASRAHAQDEHPRSPGDAWRPLRFGDPREGGYDEPFFAGAHYDSTVTTPDSVLGQEHATRLSHHAEILAILRAWAATSPRVRLEGGGLTHEGRELVYAVISAPENLARLDAIRADLGKLADPRSTSEAEAQRIVESSPAVAWMGYSIHGDELSGSDAAVALGYHLVASTEAEVAELLRALVIVIDPCLNPDGRERIIAMVEQSAGRTLPLDYASMHRGHWPWGRGNHYLFDMNRDWMAGTQPETRARWRMASSFHPQLFVDAHEMGSLDTFLFYPQAKPFNPNLPAKHVEWQTAYATGAAAAFDARGWSYYTREWADAWGPFYSDAWATLGGATGILYEQASTAGFPLRRDSGRILTYRESVHHQVTASYANLRTLAERRKEALADYAADKRRNVAEDTPGNERMLVVRPHGNAAREEELVRVLTQQGIEVWRASAEFEARGLVHAEGGRAESARFPRGTLLVLARQPLGPMLRAYLELDPRYDKEALVEEREEAERRGGTKSYDLTAWCLAHALDLDASWCAATDVPRERALGPELGDGALVLSGSAERVAWVVDGSDDRSVAFAARAMELGLAVLHASEPFTAAGKKLPRGSLLLRRSDQDGTLEQIEERIVGAALDAGVLVFGLTTGRSPDEGPDLGGQKFRLLSRPRVAVLGNAPVSPDSYGNLWHHLDQRTGIPFSLIDAQFLEQYDLRRYNVLVVPDGGGQTIAKAKDAIRTWIEDGGTLVACGGAAAEMTKGRAGLTSVALRGDVLGELASYRTAAERERAARSISVDEATLWGDAQPQEAATQAESPSGAADSSAATAGSKGDEAEPKAPTAEDEAWAQRFSPNGVTLRASVDVEHWIASGMDEVLPVLFGGDDVLLSKAPVQTPVRLDPAVTLRLGGLLWPEARERIADGAWLTVERRGAGQVILFAATPAFRGYHLATGRLFANAVVFGPGLGASQPAGW